MIDREQLKHDCADALEALLREHSVDGLHGIGDSIRILSPAYRLHLPFQVLIVTDTDRPGREQYETRGCAP